MIDTSLIPPEKLAAVERALGDSFGVTKLDDIRPITKGNTNALVFRIVVQGAPRLLRIVMRSVDPTLADHFTCMRIAAEAGLAPKVFYASVEDRVSITDFVPEVPFPKADALARMPVALRSLHSLQPFPKREARLNTTCTFLLNREVAQTGLIDRMQTSNLLPLSESRELFPLYEQLSSVCASLKPEPVSSHNDLFKPDNILFDGNRVWLVDWEAAFLNDRYADLAVIANMLADSDAEERAFLESYLGQPADDYQLARLYVMRQLAHTFYALGFLFVASFSGPVDWSEPAPDFEQLRKRIWAGETNTSERPGRIAFARANLHRLLENANTTRFAEALRLLSNPQ